MSGRLRAVAEGFERAATQGVLVDVCISPADRRTELVTDVVNGLTGATKSLPPTWFYDEQGSRLFEEITRLEEYYPTRTEAAILSENAKRIVARSGASALVELGAGISEKTLLVLDEMAAQGSLGGIATLDVSEEVLRAAAHELHERYEVPVHAVVGDFRRHLDVLPRGARRLVLFLGGTIGNLQPAARHRFLVDLEATMNHDDWLLLGTDLVKPTDRLVAAYDDAAGVTAAFNRNLLTVLNRELGADFEPEAFSHVACWNDEERWIEMRLRAGHAHQVRFDELGFEVEFAEGEEVLSEISAKFTADGIEAELWAANFVVEERWSDPSGDFLLTLSHPYC